MDIGIIYCLLISSFRLLTSPFAKGSLYQLTDTSETPPCDSLSAHHRLARRRADRIRVAVSNPNMPNLTVAVAQKKGFFKDENSKPRSSA